MWFLVGAILACASVPTVSSHIGVSLHPSKFRRVQQDGQGLFILDARRSAFTTIAIATVVVTGNINAFILDRY